MWIETDELVIDIANNKICLRRPAPQEASKVGAAHEGFDNADVSLVGLIAADAA